MGLDDGISASQCSDLMRRPLRGDVSIRSIPPDCSVRLKYVRLFLP